MKLKVIYSFFFALLAVTLLLNFSGGPARTQGQDRTGGPFSPAPCQTCHSAGAFSPELVVELLDGDDPITSYVPGQTYTFRATINTTGSPAEYGFQAVVLSGDDDVNAGTFGDPDDAFSVVELEGRDYFEHRTPNTDGVFEIEWTAPMGGTGDVRIYASGVAANGGNSTAGDGGVFLTEPVVVNEQTLSVGEVANQTVRLEVFPNPVQDFANLNIELEAAGRFNIQVFDIMGRQIQSNMVELIAGSNQVPLNTNDLDAGVYHVHLTDGKSGITERILKR